MKNKASKPYIDDESLNFQQAIANLVNSNFRGAATTAEILECNLDELEKLDTHGFTTQQNKYLQLAIKIAENRFQLAIDLGELLTMAMNDKNKIGDISTIESFIDDTGEIRLITESVDNWSDELLLASAKPKRNDKCDFYCDVESLPSPAENVKIALASALELLAKQEADGEKCVPKISTLATKLKSSMYGQKYDNLRTLFKNSLQIKKSYFNTLK
ncbi:MAG: hypothetical protein JKY55_14010 [Aliivibrio sp.]|uniref:hypothetical protein n=1 Tax=Aliivibrio sp. TaxID=1872443 RepID=UPI001A609D28|nr:hypothetical protein [Aliivibrio sp.]